MHVVLIHFNKPGVHEPGILPVPPISLEDDLKHVRHSVALLATPQDSTVITFRKLSADLLSAESSSDSSARGSGCASCDHDSHRAARPICKAFEELAPHNSTQNFQLSSLPTGSETTLLSIEVA